MANKKEYVCIVGGANIDIQGFPKGRLVLRDSNPGEVKLSTGGVGRNIGENLARLGVNTKLISAVGDDIYGNKIIEEAKALGLDMQDSFVFDNSSTSTYLSILDENGDMAAAISHMDIYDKLSIDLVKDKRYIIENSKLCIFDTNIPVDVIEYIVRNFNNTEFFLDTVSTAKAKKVEHLIGYFHTIKPNQLEAEALSGIKIKTRIDLRKAAEYFMRKGVKRVFITLGKEGVYYMDGESENLIAAPEVKVINATGAGDAFVAALAWCHLNNSDIEYTSRFAMSASILALSHENTINPNMSSDNVKRKMEELKIC
jgi:pseudouridine kinase